MFNCIGSCTSLNITGCCTSSCRTGACYCDQSCYQNNNCCPDIASIGCLPSSTSTNPTPTPSGKYKLVLGSKYIHLQCVIFLEAYVWLMD